MVDSNVYRPYICLHPIIQTHLWHFKPLSIIIYHFDVSFITMSGIDIFFILRIKSKLPASSATFQCVEAAQAFCLDMSDLHSITEHFRYKFANEKLKRTTRYCSSNWRTWATVNIQLTWHRYRARTADGGWTQRRTTGTTSGSDTTRPCLYLGGWAEARRNWSGTSMVRYER
jgi:hypothetical protein